jgi:hypothetical protein
LHKRARPLGLPGPLIRSSNCMRAFAHVGFVVLFAALSGSIGCGKKTPTEPDAPVYELKTEVFSGSVKTGGSTAFHFTVVNPGRLQVAITELGPTSTLVMGISLGFWDAATEVCVEQVQTPVATLNVVYEANPQQPGEYCAAVFDTGNVVITADFKLTVAHY